VLWNFPDATTLTISSTTIPGSILAPKAAANFSYGNIVGTVVAKSVASSAELEWNPYQVPSSGGCLSFDSSWSCSHDTVLDDTGLHAAAIKAEAGFLDIPRDTYTWNLQQRTSPEHRVWYAFQPAATIPTSKPLVVFFNGGPGSATLVVPPMLAVTPLAPPAVPVAPPSEVSFFVTPRRRFIGVRKQASPIEDNATHSASQQRPQLITGRLAESRYGRLTDYKLPSG